jgi:hypothetical protein
MAHPKKRGAGGSLPPAPKYSPQANGNLEGSPSKAILSKGSNLRELRKAALGYVAKAWALVPVHNKRPIGLDWNTATAMRHAADIAKQFGKHPQTNGVGVLLASSKLCSFDADRLDRTRAGLAKLATPIDVDTVLESGWHIRSGKPNSARSLFVVPKGPKLRWKQLRVRKPVAEWTNVDPETGELRPAYGIVFELRAESPNLQDVLPPSLHDTGTTYTAPPLPEDLPVLAGPLLDLWRRWQADPKAVEAELFDAFGVPEADRVHSLSGKPGKLDYENKALRTPYNDANSVESVLLRHGYTDHGAGRWAHPGATGAPGCQPIDTDKRPGLWHSHNGGDPLFGTFDAWTAHVQLDHGGDQKAAEAAWYAEHPKGSEFEPIEGHEGDDDEEAEDNELLQGLPTLPEAALYGILRPIVEAATRHTEATRVGVAVALLVEFAARYGGALRLRIGDEDRTVPLYALLVGPTAKGRKGTSAAFPVKLFEAVDRRLAPDPWDEEPHTLPGAPQRTTGVSSGQGIIAFVRDAGERITPSGTVHDMPGAEDKRLLIDLSEFATVFVASANENNTLSPVLRDAFDAKRLQNPTVTNYLCATGAHVCVFGHITMHEFRKHTIDSKRNTDISNGLLNRFAIVYSARDKMVSMPDAVPWEVRNALAKALADNVREVFRGVGDVGPNDRRVVEYRMDRAATALWKRNYEAVSGARYDSAVVDALLSRRELLVRTLAVLLAATNGERIVTAPALEAALAWSQYMVDSTTRVFARAGERRKANELRRDIAAITEWARTSRRGEPFANRDFVMRFGRWDSKRRNSVLRAMLETAPAQLVHDGKTYRLA